MKKQRGILKNKRLGKNPSQNRRLVDGRTSRHDLMPGLVRTSLVIPFALFCFAQQLLAAEATTEDCVAPDFKHEIVLFSDGDSGVGEYKLAIRVPSADKPLYSRPAGGFAAFNSATTPANFKCLWGSDSKFVAIFERGEKRGGETSIYLVSGAKVREVIFPDLMPLVRPHLTSEMRAFYVRPEVWLPDHELLLSVVFTQLDEEHGAFRFILTLQLGKTTFEHPRAKIASFRQDKAFK